MSGFVAIVSTANRCVDPRIVERMTATMKFRGNADPRTWIEQPVGLGHVLLKTTEAAPVQPLSTDGSVWIVGDIRLDERDRLVADLQEAGYDATFETSDPQLTLLAYAAWRDKCVEHLQGDFAFVIWDAARQSLFAARDRIGVRPLFYARAGSELIVTNTLKCALEHPQVSRQLDEAAIGDFLLFGRNLHTGQTTYRQVKQLSSAHCLRATVGQSVQTRAYWAPEELPLPRQIQPADYVDQFRDLLSKAVSNRLPPGRVSVSMSGGLDSSCIAAICRAMAQKRGGQHEIRAVTIVYDRLLPDQERRYAQLAADILRLPIEFVVADEHELFPTTGEPAPEPLESHALRGIHVQLCQTASRHSHVMLTGGGADEGLFASQSYVYRAISRGRWGQALRALWHYVHHQGKLPRMGVKTAARSWIYPRDPIPGWIEPTFAKRLALRDRLHDVWASYYRDPRAILNRCITSGLYQYDAGVTGIPLEIRHPFYDATLIQFLFSVPPVFPQPKALLRQAFATMLPEAILNRPKTYLAGDPIQARYQAGQRVCFAAVPHVRQFVCPESVPVPGSANDCCPAESYSHTRPYVLANWLQAAGLAN